MNRSHYFKTKRELRSLYAVLKEWVRLNRNLGRQWSKSAHDLPWWYNERALLSVLAGAIWRTGGHAFEEFSETKLVGAKKKKSKGRVDLWFETSGGEFRAEVKHAEVPIGKNGQQLSSLRAVMRRAIADARCNPADGHSRRLAIGFAIPYLSESLDQKKRDERIAWFLSIVPKVDHDAIAWTFPSIKKLPAHSGLVCPGIVVWIKRVRRSP